MKKSIIEITLDGKDALKAIEYLLGFRGSSVDPSGKSSIRVEVRDGVEVGSESSSGAEHDPAGNSLGDSGDGGSDRSRISIDVANFDPQRFGINASELPYKTSATFAALASRSLANYERKWTQSHDRLRGRGRNESLMPTFSDDIGKVVIPLAETILRMPNSTARRDFLCAFLGYYAARSYGYTLDYDSIDDLMEIWRREKNHVGDNSLMTKSLQELLSHTLETLSEPLLTVMRVEQ